jgi:hypothetical protein
MRTRLKISGCICLGVYHYLLQSAPRGGESVCMRMVKVRQYFYNFYEYSYLEEIVKKRKWMSMRGLCW